MPSATFPNACLSVMAKNMPNSVGERTQPCFTLLRILHESTVEQLKTSVPFILDCKNLKMLSSFGGQSIFGKILNGPSLLTKSKALVRSMKALKSGCCCSLHFSCSCREEKGHVDGRSTFANTAL